MPKTIFSKVIWAGKAATFAVGLAVVLAMTLAIVATAAEAAKAKSLKLGIQNTVSAATTMVGSVEGPILSLGNTNGTTGSALDLQVKPGNAPMTVNSRGQVYNLNADLLDGMNAGDFQLTNPCPNGTIYLESVCVEGDERGSPGSTVSFSAAQTDCLDETFTRLPTPAELQTLQSIRPEVNEWSNHAFQDSGTDKAIVVKTDRTLQTSLQSDSASYRCVLVPRY